ncbi:MAG: ABC transporter permease, partial [Alphaproteobacteria bacterium]
GADPVEAVKYQLLVMFLIGGATGIGAVMAIYAAVWRITDPRHRLRLDRIEGTDQ